MLVKLWLWILLVSIEQVSSNPRQRNCSTSESIKGGNATYSQGGLEGSVLTYHCRPGQYPSPVSSRTCKANGQWTTMRLSSGRPVTRATCKDVMCPAQLQLDNGHFWPREQWFRVGALQSFSCEEGFKLHGSAQRNCTLTGEWTGSTPVCRDYADDCDDPGTPPGAQRQRFSGQFLSGERVTYSCHSGLELLGSSKRVCLENREWSGSEPRCQSPYTFDSPSSVAAAMAGSLAGVMDVLTPDSIQQNTFQRSIRPSEDSRLNVFILLDTSGSITQQDFELSRTATIALIRKLSTYEVQMKYHVLSFATEVIVITDILNTYTSSYGDRVIHTLEKFDPKSHGHKTGTNLYTALSHVNACIAFLKKTKDSHFTETQNVIVIETDGYSNVGNKSSLAMQMIRATLGYNHTAIEHTHERLLDVYVFGIGSKVKKDELNSLASKKRGENHIFILKDYEVLGEVFNDIISDKTVTVCGVAQEDVPDSPEFYTHPWHVYFVANGTRCSGSIVSSNWVLTAAHCFGRKGSEKVPQKVEINHGEGTVMSSRVIMHPKFDVGALKQRNVKEFYDYDVALVQLNTSIPLSWKARPICLPCTVPANRAMKQVNSTCLQHRMELFPHMQTSASFLHQIAKESKVFERKDTHIHTGKQREACVDKARQTLKNKTDITLEEYVPDTFLCSGGTVGKQDAVTCKGDSGGSLYLQKSKRFFQVGVVSWGTHNCEMQPTARDFHIDLFKVMLWLKKHLGKEIKFLPDVN